jgi:hypothetical protein
MAEPGFALGRVRLAGWNGKRLFDGWRIDHPVYLPTSADAQTSART